MNTFTENKEMKLPMKIQLFRNTKFHSSESNENKNKNKAANHKLYGFFFYMNGKPFSMGLA